MDNNKTQTTGPSVLKTTEASLPASELAEMLEFSPQAFVLNYFDSRASVCNDAFTRLLGYSMSELEVIDWAILTPLRWREPEREKLSELHRTGGPICYEKEYIDKNGHCFPVELCWHLHRNAQGEADYRYAFITDSSNRKRAEEASKQSHSLVRATLDGLSANIVLLDAQGSILLANKAWHDFAKGNGLEVRDYSRAASYLDVCDNSAQSGSHEAAMFAHGIRACLAGEMDSFTMEYPCDSPATKLWFVGRVTPFVINGEKHVVVAHEDITEHKLKEELDSHVERIIQHNLRAPASAAVHVARLLRDGADMPEEQRLKFLDQLEQSGENMLDTIDNSLNIFNIETGQYQSKIENFDCLALVTNVIETLRARAPFSGNKLTLLADGQPLKPEARSPCRGDFHMLRAALQNLLANAFEASAPTGNVTVELSSDKAHCRIDITNDGVVPLEIRDRFFDRYVTSGKFLGTGIGTYSAQMMLRAQGGDISMCTSDIDGKTKVTVRMPS